MMIPLRIWLAAVAASAAGANAQPAPVQLTQAAPPDTIVYETTSWGRVTYHLELHRDGRLRAWRYDFNGGERREERDEQRAPSLYTQALAAIAPLGSAPELSCGGAPTDGPSGYYHWNTAPGPQEYIVYYGCYAIDPLPAINRQMQLAEDRFFALVAPRPGATP